MKKIDSAWFSLLFSIPGIIFIVLVFLGMLGIKIINFGEFPGLAGVFAVAIFVIFMVIAHFVSLIPAWLLLRKSENKILSFRIGTFFGLLTLLIFIILYLGGMTDVYVFIIGIILLFLLWWFLIYKKFR